jgi:hypothetical protein
MMLYNPSKPSIAQEVITPLRARDYLNNNTLNRKVDRKRVKDFCELIRTGDFYLSSDAISFDTNGVMISGQHRLLACVETGIPIECFVARGLSPDLRPHTDLQKPRSAADNLDLSGAQNTKAAAAGIQTILKIRAGTMANHDNFPHRAVVAFYKENPNIAASVQATRGCHAILRNSLSIGLHFLFSEKDRDAADMYFIDLKNGLALAPDDSLYLFREAQIKIATSKMKPTRDEVAARAIWAWNTRRAGLKAKRLCGIVNGVFPRIV